jgi:hypothetical protein
MNNVVPKILIFLLLIVSPFNHLLADEPTEDVSDHTSGTYTVAVIAPTGGFFLGADWFYHYAAPLLWGVTKKCWSIGSEDEAPEEEPAEEPEDEGGNAEVEGETEDEGGIVDTVVDAGAAVGNGVVGLAAGAGAVVCGTIGGIGHGALWLVDLPFGGAPQSCHEKALAAEAENAGSYGGACGGPCELSDDTEGVCRQASKSSECECKPQLTIAEIDRIIFETIESPAPIINKNSSLEKNN